MNIEKNKEVVRRFNTEVIENNNLEVFNEIMHPDFINHTAANGISKGADGILYTFNTILRPAFPDLKVEIHEQIAEGNKVTTRKTIHGTHLGIFQGLPPTNKKIAISVIDIVHVKNGQYFEHWGINTLSQLLAQLK